MDAPDELRRAVAVAIFGADYDWTAEEAVWAAKEQNEAWAKDMADAVLAVPAIADALRAAEEEEVYRTALGLACSDGWSDGQSAMESYIETAKAHIAALRAITAAS